MRTEALPERHLSVLNLGAYSTRPGSDHELSSEVLAANLVVGFERADARAHPFFGMRSQLLKYAQETGRRVFAVTSVQPGNGKSHIAANLAAVVSRIAPTVLIELDLRRPSLGARLGLPGDHPGIDDFLEQKASLIDTAIAIRGFNLTVHRVRRARENPEELLSSNRLLTCFDQIRSRQSGPICIVDVPPAIIDDTVLIKRAVDGALIVVEEGRTAKRGLRSVIETLSPTPIVGAVLNKSISSPVRGIDYGYYNQETPPLEARDWS